MHRETDKIMFTLGTDDILYIECAPKTIMTLEDARESTRIGGELVNLKPRPLLCDLTNVVKMNQACQEPFRRI